MPVNMVQIDQWLPMVDGLKIKLGDICGVMEMSCMLITALVTLVYTLVKSYQTMLKMGHFIA